MYTAHMAIMSEPYRHDIDGLRAVAVILVIFYHAFPQLIPGGYIGVDVFFVISGFVITSKIVQDVRSGRFAYSDFYANRLRRLLPALVVVLTVSLCIGWLLLLPGQMSALTEQVIASLLFVPNILFWTQAGYFDTAAEAKPLLHLWSLGVEEQFYLVWPVILTLLATLRPRFLISVLVLLIVVSFAYSAYAAYYTPTAAYYSPLSRFWQLGCGCLLALLPRSSNRFEIGALAGLAVIFASSLTLSRASIFPGINAIPAVAGAGAVIFFRSQSLANPAATFIGRISYSLYLWHLPLLTFARFERWESNEIKLCIIILSALLGACTTYLIENPIRRQPQVSKRAIPAILVSMFTVIAISILIVRSGGGIPLYAKEVQPVARLMTYPATLDARFPGCWLPNAEPFSSYSSECFKGETVLWGDSHAARLYSGFASDAVSVAQLTRNSCWPVLRSQYPLCADSNERVLNDILRRQPKRVILYAAWLNYSIDRVIEPSDMEKIVETLTALQHSGADLVLLGPAPIWPGNLPNIVYDYWRRNGELPDRLHPQPHDYAAADDFLRLASQRSGVRFMSVYDALCDERGCLTHTTKSRNDLWTWDYGHLTSEGADFLLRHLDLK